jgi:hypothetical protein
MLMSNDCSHNEHHSPEPVVNESTETLIVFQNLPAILQIVEVQPLPERHGQDKDTAAGLMSLSLFVMVGDCL